VKHNKLIRDKILGVLVGAGVRYRAHVADSTEYESYLIKKMEEELAEFVSAPSLEEAADIYEVFLAFLKNWNFSLEDVLATASEKRDCKGAFKCGIILDETLEGEGA
jgi:predicted house-cleaning noncanonical NTP pyrophosphatase (MazG superfamily)